MDTMDNEKLIYKYYRMVPYRNIICFGRFFHCLRIKIITKSILFKFGWKDSSGKDQLPSDFYNDKRKMMMDFMRIDDCVNKIDGKKIDNSFAKANKDIDKYLGKQNKKEIDSTVIYISDTSDSREFNYEGYVNNFKRVLLDHSNKIPNYKSNHPKSKTTILFVCDESNTYVQANNENDLKKGNEKNLILEKCSPHHHFHDSEFINIIKSTQADYVIWFGLTKSLFVNNKKYKYPNVAIYDVKHLKISGLKYNSKLMLKVKEEKLPKRLI